MTKAIIHESDLDFKKFDKKFNSKTTKNLEKAKKK